MMAVKCYEATKRAVYHLMTSEHGHMYPTIAGILLFGKRPQFFFSEAMIICTHFAGVSGREVIATVDCEGSGLSDEKYLIEKSRLLSMLCVSLCALCSLWFKF